MAKLKPGDKAPAFTLASDTDGKVSLSQLKGKKVVLYFYPKDNTPGCTIQACDYRDLQKDFKKQDSVVLGVSKDSLESHEKFRKDHKLNFPLLSDPDLKVHKAYGAYGKKMMYGKESIGVIRTTVIIDEKGKIASIGAVKAKGNAAKSLDLLS
jgi:peroxiredoxin Q/BCP